MLDLVEKRGIDLSKTWTEKEKRLNPGPVILAFIGHTFTNCLVQEKVKWFFLVTFNR